jgi:hypothetical protein
MNVQFREVTTRRTKMVVDDKEQFELTFTDIVEDSVKITETEEGYEVRYLVRDDNAESPDEFGDDGAFLVHYHRSFDIRRDRIITADDARDWYQGRKIPQQKDYHIFAVSAYIHSGVALSLSNDTYPFNDRWDVSHVGLILLSKKEWKTKSKRALKYAQGLIETWNQYLCGDVYGIVCEKFDKKRNSIDHESVWGFYGEKYALEALETDI